MVWVKAAAGSDVKQDRLCYAYPLGIAVIIVRKGKEIHAIRNRCPHLSCQFNSADVSGDTLKCPCHDWEFDIASGSLLASPEIRLTKYQTRLQGSDIMINMKED